MKLYRYCSTLRPIDIGTTPSNRHKVDFKNFDNKQDYQGIQCWGYVDYVEPLTKEQQYVYDLVFVGNIAK